MWSGPVGLGANRTRIFLSVIVLLNFPAKIRKSLHPDSFYALPNGFRLFNFNG
jgi:hypothetical protein